MSGLEKLLTVWTYVSIFLALALLWALLFHFEGESQSGLSSTLNLASPKLFPYFNLHPFLMSIGVIFFMTQGVLAYRIFPFSRPVQKALHGICQACATAFMAGGAYVVFNFHGQLQVQPLYSLHSWMGVITLGLMACELLFGVSIFAIGKKLLSDNTRASLSPFHVFFGRCTYFCALCAICLGLFDFQNLISLAELEGLFPGCTVSATDNSYLFCSTAHYINIVFVFVLILAFTVGFHLFITQPKKSENARFDELSTPLSHLM